MIRCLAVDDESLSLDLLEDNIRRVPFLQLVQNCHNAYEAMEVMRHEPIQLLFLDIQMPGLTGMQLLQSLPVKPMVIFVTAYKKYAWEGFELDVLDYLVKPVAFDRFLKAVNKAMEYHTLRNNQSLSALPPSPPDFFFVNVEYNLVKIIINDICYVEGLKDYCKIYLCHSDRPVLTRMLVKNLVEKLPASKFIRVHKSYIIAIDKITVIRKNLIYLGQHPIPVSDLYRAELFELINIK